MNEILVIGNSAVDLIAATIERFPEPGGAVTFDEALLRPGGCGVNVAMALGRLGLGCDLVTRIGEDRLGSFLVDELESVGVNGGSLVIDSEAATPFSFVMLDRARERSYFHCRGTNDHIRVSDIKDGALFGKRVVAVTGAMGMASLDGPPLAEILGTARRNGIMTILDTQFQAVSRDRWIDALVPALEYCDVFAPSLEEGKRLTGLEEPAAIATQIAELGAENVVIKLGANGAYVLAADGTRFLVPALPLDRVVDSTGAGDCFIAGVIAGFVTHLSLLDAVRVGAAVAWYGLRAFGATDGVPPLGTVLAKIGIPLRA